MAVLVWGLLGAGGALAEFPREGVPEVPNGVPAPFVGAWQIGFPEGEGMINGEPIVVCGDPVRLRADGDTHIIYASPTGQETRFELMAFSGRTSWLPEGGESTLAVFTGPDSFFTYTVDLMTGRARWDDPRVFTRCPG
ncbi:hypothetical protein EMQ25_02435 [Arsenicitalea aurantiaca]|uniref:Uncharacterized protein n=1 Tax=Arsenicitalea aurantiaca TaxID=1783274 RepID=A0A433XL78_9HYPH|nr:hypothetical protein [Arsenicitalea aurantiaca]RUT34836.1 hypothetical protein EMQ25_02435 [Arsenicitalea aurantiaca]